MKLVGKNRKIPTGDDDVPKGWKPLHIKQATYERLADRKDGTFDKTINDILDNYDAAIEIAKMWKGVDSATYLRLFRMKNYPDDSLGTIINALLDGEPYGEKK